MKENGGWKDDDIQTRLPEIVKSFYSTDSLGDLVCDDGASQQLQSNEDGEKRGGRLRRRNYVCPAGKRESEVSIRRNSPFIMKQRDNRGQTKMKKSFLILAPENVDTGYCNWKHVLYRIKFRVHLSHVLHNVYEPWERTHKSVKVPNRWRIFCRRPILNYSAMFINNEVTAQHFLEFDAKFVWIIVKKDFLEKIKTRVPFLKLICWFCNRDFFRLLLPQAFIVVICWEISHHFIELPHCKFVLLWSWN